MKKFWKRIIITALIVLLFVPAPFRIVYKDGGTRDIMALTYRIVIWNVMVDDNEINSYLVKDGIYHRRAFYILPFNWKSIDELWKMEIKRYSK